MFQLPYGEDFAFVASPRSICLVHLHLRPGEGCMRRGCPGLPGCGGLGGSFALASGEKLDLRVTRVKQTPR